MTVMIETRSTQSKDAASARTSKGPFLLPAQPTTSRRGMYAAASTLISACMCVLTTPYREGVGVLRQAHTYTLPEADNFPPNNPGSMPGVGWRAQGIERDKAHPLSETAPHLTLGQQPPYTPKRTR